MTAYPASPAPANVTGFLGLYSRAASGWAKLRLRRERWGLSYYVVHDFSWTPSPRSSPASPGNRGKLSPGEGGVSTEISIRPFVEADAPQVRALFIAVNRLLAPPDLRDGFEAYITRSLAEEIDRIDVYYGAREGGFWVAHGGDLIVGTFGLERAEGQAMELRRMYVDPAARRAGIARQMLQFAEEECRRRDIPRLELSTSELQHAALALYRQAGYLLLREEVAEPASNKTVGGGIRRYYFAKTL
jgi:putative acetyltransferase